MKRILIFVLFVVCLWALPQEEVLRLYPGKIMFERNLNPNSTNVISEVGLAMQAEMDSILLTLRDCVERNIDEAAEDSVVYLSEMNSISVSVEAFLNKKEIFDRRLEFYKLETQVELPAGWKNIVEVYFDGWFFYGDNDEGCIKTFFVKRYKKDISVIESPSNLRIILWVLFLVIILLCVIAVIRKLVE